MPTKPGPPIAIRQTGPHSFEAVPTIHMGSVVDSLEEDLALLIGAAQRIARSGDSTPKIRRRVQAARRVLEGLEAELTAERRIAALVAALQEANTITITDGDADAAREAWARQVFASRLGHEVIVDASVLKTAIAAWRLRGKNKLPAVHALARALKIGAEDAESFRTQVQRAIAKQR